MGFKIIVITPEVTSKNEILELNKLFLAGLKILHVRKPNFTKTELKNYLTQIPKQFHKRIVIHSHYELTKEFNLKGIHLTENARKLISGIKNKKIISTSFHSEKSILKSRRKHEYVFLSPIFDSISKHNYKSNFDLESLQPFLKKNKNKIIALGGINTKNIKPVKQIGFSGAAAIGFIWENGNPIKNYKKLISKIE